MKLYTIIQKVKTRVIYLFLPKPSESLRKSNNEKIAKMLIRIPITIKERKNHKFSSIEDLRLECGVSTPFKNLHKVYN